MKASKRVEFTLALFTAIILINNVSADTEIINLKADSTWKASSVITSTDWFKLDFDDSQWSSSVGRWENNPCVKYCGKMTSCELTCIDWMWYGESCKYCETYYRKTISLPEEVMSATITITADNFYWLYINGNYIGSDTTRNGYQKPESYDITSYMRPGKNVIAIKAQNDGEYEGVALTGEIKYKTYDTLINQLQSEIDSLEYQLNALSSDKNRLEKQVDTLQQQAGNLTTTKDYLTSENSRLQLENAELKNTRYQLETALAEAESSLDTHRILNIVLILGLLITLGITIAVLYYFYDKLKGRRPRLSQSAKKTPVERTAIESEGRGLSEHELKELTPIFQRKRVSALSRKPGE